MPRLRHWLIVASPLILSALFLPRPVLAAEPIEGNWVNPHGSVVVTTGACRDALCGWVRWADGHATADAAVPGSRIWSAPHCFRIIIIAGRGAGPAMYSCLTRAAAFPRRSSNSMPID